MASTKTTYILDFLMNIFKSALNYEDSRFERYLKNNHELKFSLKKYISAMDHKKRKKYTL